MNQQLRYEEQQVRGINFPEVESTLMIPDALRLALAACGLDAAREFVPLIRGQNPHTTSVIARRFEAKTTVADQSRVAAAIGVRMAAGNESLAWVKARWGPKVQPLRRPPTPKARRDLSWTYWSRARRYGLESAQIVDMLKAQHYRCAICPTGFDTPGAVCFDHNHETGLLRGLICGPCNTALGLFRDSPAVLRNAAAYLEQRGFYGPRKVPK